jgi:hypothetical protein
MCQSSPVKTQTLTITLDSNPSDAPGCLKIVASDGRTRLIQTDYDWPGIASVFGWSVADVRTPSDCQHEGTDGTIACPSCHLSASEFIQAAREWIDDNDGATTADPGYFD